MDEYILHQKKRADTRTNEELFHIALTNTEEDTVWEAIGMLHFRGGLDVFERSCKLCASPEARERCVGVAILAQLDYNDNYPFSEETLAVLLDMLERERETDVLSSIATALGHSNRRDPRTIEPLGRLKNHPDEQVRSGVVFGLWFQEDERAIQTLIELSTDLDTRVRDWATFGLGSAIEADTPIIREALVARLNDEHEDTSGEAMVGLARRHDLRVVDPLLKDLAAGWPGSLLLEAATEIGDPRLYPVLVRLREAWQGDQNDRRYTMLEEAITQCQLAHMKPAMKQSE